VGTPFFLFTNGTSPRGLFADAYQPDTPVTGGASGISSSAATVAGSVNPEGASVNVSFEYGLTTAYGQTTTARPTGVSNAPTPFSEELSGLPAGATIHYRAVAVSDFGKFVGADQTLTTAPSPPPPPPPGPGTTSVGRAHVSAARSSGATASVRASCVGPAGATCLLAFKLTVSETFRGHRLVAVTARRGTHRARKVVVVGAASALLSAGETKLVRISLNRTGKRLLASRHRLKATLRVTQATPAGDVATVSTQTVTFKQAKGHARRAH
jgi:hypothetical protein